MLKTAVRPRMLVTGVAVVVAMVALSLVPWIATAAPGDDDTTYVPIAPCRLFDTRTGKHTVGPRNTPLGHGETHVVQVTGTNGNCTIPADAVAVSMNVTITDPTLASYLTIYPAHLSSRPLASNLNWVTGQAPTPNKVDATLSPAGAISMYNNAGKVNVLADVTGYSTQTSLADLAAQVAALQAAQPFAVHNGGDQTIRIGNDVVVRSIKVTAPVAGTVTVDSTVQVSESTANHGVVCSIGDSATRDEDYAQIWFSPGIAGQNSQLAGTRGFDIAAGTSATYNLVCAPTIPPNTAVITDSSLTAIFTPAP